jgi:hypothetical protein
MLSASPPVAERPAYRAIISTEKPAVAPSVEMLAEELLQQHPHFRGRQHLVRFRCQGKCLTIEGHLPSYFMKQLAQEAIRSLSGLETIDNQIAVEGVIYDGWPMLPIEKLDNESIDTTLNPTSLALSTPRALSVIDPPKFLDSRKRQTLVMAQINQTLATLASMSRA